MAVRGSPRFAPALALHLQDRRVKRLFACTLLVALPAIASADTTSTTTPHATNAPVKAHVAVAAQPHPVAHTKVAPADEYFGRLKMSILGIRNQIKDLGLRADADPLKATSIMGTATLTEDAVRDWQRKYPADGWIPGAIFALERLYAKVDSDDARLHAKAAMVWLVQAYPANNFARIGKQELAQNLVGARPAVPATTAAVPAAAAVTPAPVAPAPAVAGDAAPAPLTSPAAAP
jgi:hypothetical protein